jgi:hypothetical protein
LVRQAGQPGRWLAAEHQRPSPSRVHPQAQGRAAEAFRAGRAVGEVLGAPHEARPRRGLDFSDYPEALQHFFTYVARTNMRKQLVFSDYYKVAAVPDFAEPVQLIDPVNAKNNVSCLYTAPEADMIVEAALDAGDAIDAALAAPTKGETVAYWQKVFGSSFQV